MNSYIIFNKTTNKAVVDADSNYPPPDNVFITNKFSEACDALTRIKALAQLNPNHKNDEFEIRKR